MQNRALSPWVARAYRLLPILLLAGSGTPRQLSAAMVSAASEERSHLYCPPEPIHISCPCASATLSFMEVKDQYIQLPNGTETVLAKGAPLLKLELSMNLLQWHKAPLWRPAVPPAELSVPKYYETGAAEVWASLKEAIVKRSGKVLREALEEALGKPLGISQESDERPFQDIVPVILAYAGDIFDLFAHGTLWDEESLFEIGSPKLMITGKDAKEEMLATELASWFVFELYTPYADWKKDLRGNKDFLDRWNTYQLSMVAHTEAGSPAYSQRCIEILEPRRSSKGLLALLAPVTVCACEPGVVGNYDGKITRVPSYWFAIPYIGWPSSCVRLPAQPSTTFRESYLAIFGYTKAALIDALSYLFFTGVGKAIFLAREVWAGRDKPWGNRGAAVAIDLVAAAAAIGCFHSYLLPLPLHNRIDLFGFLPNCCVCVGVGICIASLHKKTQQSRNPGKKRATKKRFSKGPAARRTRARSSLHVLRRKILLLMVKLSRVVVVYMIYQILDLLLDEYFGFFFYRSAPPADQVWLHQQVPEHCAGDAFIQADRFTLLADFSGWLSGRGSMFFFLLMLLGGKEEVWSFFSAAKAFAIFFDIHEKALRAYVVQRFKNILHGWCHGFDE